MIRLAVVFCAAGALVAAASSQATKAIDTFDAVWTIVRDTHFDLTFNGVDWPAVRDELRPKAAAARSDDELRTIIRDMLGRLGQSHFALIPSSADAGTPSGDLGADLGLDVRLLGDAAIVTRVEPAGGAAAAGVKPGWRIVEIGGRAVSALLAPLPDGMSERLRLVEGWRILESRLRGPNGSAVTIAFEDGAGQTKRLQVLRRSEKGQPVTVGNLPTMYVRVESEPRRTPGGATAGVIRFNVWMPAVDAQFQEAVDRFRSADGIIIDLRGNPGGLAAMLMGISGHFLKERKPLGVMKTRDNELRFVANPRLVNAAGQRVEPFAGPVAILVDALTGSASECFTGGMQAIGRARVFGQTSMGQALPALFKRLPNDDILIHAYGDFVTADGTRLEARGVIPDDVVPLRREDLLAGRDVTLERALAWIDAARRR